MALLDGLEQLPVKKVAYEGMTLREFDIDAALKRNPQLILVDEFAHTNIESSRHTKRYQDVQELLNAGIDVYTTVNAQHIESLNDTVASITGILVRERIPDSAFDQADQVDWWILNLRSCWKDWQVEMCTGKTRPNGQQLISSRWKSDCIEGNCSSPMC